MTLKFELSEAIQAIEIAIKQHSGMRPTKASRTIVKGSKVVTQPDVLTAHRLDQINRILRWAEAHWDTFEPELHEWLYPERR